MSCKWNGRGEPRVLPGRHLDECAEGCSGCLPCPERHCGTCSRAHAAVTCAECVATVRDDLAQIRLMCGALPAEVEHRGVNGEAMMLLGPAANAEAWSNRALSATLGRVDDAYLEDCRDEAHPLWVLGTWSEVWRDHLNQPTDMTITIDRAGDYIDRHLHEMAEVDEPDFAQFVGEVRGCRGHLQTILSDQNQGDAANIGCFECGAKIERRLTERGFEDVWTCRGCRRKYTYAEYNFALRAELEARKETA